MAGHFGRAVFVNAQDVVLKKDSLSFGRIFDQPNRTQAEWIRFFSIIQIVFVTRLV